MKSRLLEVRGQHVLLAQDVAKLYCVEPRYVAQAVKNNPDKFPAGYVFDLSKDEIDSLKSKFLILDEGGRGQHSKRGYKALTERGLYMLATILKGETANPRDSGHYRDLCPSALDGAGYGGASVTEGWKCRASDAADEGWAQAGGFNRQQPFD